MSNHQMPRHVAIIMDGNGRWAKRRLFPRTSGHKAAVKSVCQSIEYAAENKISVLTLFAFGRENWQRPKEEVDTLMTLFAKVLVDELPLLQKHDIRLSIVGDKSRLSSEVVDYVTHAIGETKENQGLQLNVAIDYSGQWEITQAAKQLAIEVKKDKLSIDQIDEQAFNRYLIPEITSPVDLLIRTSGELRISNFMIWQLAYAELYFCDKYWPDFRKKDFEQATQAYQARCRRFGKTDEQLKGGM